MCVLLVGGAPTCPVHLLQHRVLYMQGHPLGQPLTVSSALSGFPLSPSSASSLPPTPCPSGGVFYTDANGLEWQQRKLGYRPAYAFSDTNLPANLYPMTTGIGCCWGDPGGGAGGTGTVAVGGSQEGGGWRFAGMAVVSDTNLPQLYPDNRYSCCLRGAWGGGGVAVRHG